MALGVEHANDGSAANVIAGARNQGWSRGVELAMIEAARESERLCVRSASEVTT
jgi:hypothetical protein